jgi:hypothetical protein
MARIRKIFWSRIMNGLYGCNNPWALTPTEINQAHQNIPMIPTPITENLVTTMSKSVAFEAQKKLMEFLKENNFLEHRIKNFATMECEEGCLSCKLLKEFGVK